MLPFSQLTLSIRISNLIDHVLYIDSVWVEQHSNITIGHAMEVLLPDVSSLLPLGLALPMPIQLTQIAPLLWA